MQIIKACKENGIVELAFADFRLRFDSAKTNATEHITPTATIPEEVPKASQKDIALQIENERLEEEKDDVAMLTIEDPLKMEEMIAKGELVDEVT